MKKHYYLLLMIACMLFSCKPDPEKPTVTTLEVSNITATTAKSGGKVLSDGDADVTSRGICWSKSQNPTVNSSHTNNVNGVGSYISTMSDLVPNTTYYVRAYATNSAGTSYGNEVSFTTLEQNEGNEEEVTLPTVAAAVVVEVTETTAVVSAEVTADGGAEVTARGVCWSMTQNPTTGNDFTEEGTGVGAFTSNLDELMPNTTYYVRAYATNSEGTAYGEEVSFTTLEEIVITLPEVVTSPISEITDNSAIGGGNVTSDGNAEVTARGVCWGMTQNPTIENNITTDGSGTGDFASQIVNLVPQTTYYVRAYATNSEGTAYGEEVSFTTLAASNVINGYEYVDLGLPSGVKWATMNVGATSPEEKGNYYAWGELQPKTEYTEMTCTSYKLNIEDVSGNPEYDVARVDWGATWRMPTADEFNELLENCTWEWEVRNGIGGKKVIGPNGNHIFMPISGYIYGTAYYMEDFGYYWTSTPIEGYKNYAYDFFFDQELNLSMGYDDRCYGQPVRPVSD